MPSTVSSVYRHDTGSHHADGPGASGKKEGKTRLLNIVMQLRKCCNHPYREWPHPFAVR